MYARELTKPITSLKGIGKALSSSYESLQITTWFDLLSHLPRSYEDRSRIRPFSKGYDGSAVNTVMEVVDHQFFFYRRGRVLKVIVRDESGPAALLCFGRNFLQQSLEIGKRFYFYGQGQAARGELQFSSFEFEAYVEGTAPRNFGIILPIYSLAGRLTQKIIRRNMKQVLAGAGTYVENELPEYIEAEEGLYTANAAFREVHFPRTPDSAQRARKTLSYTELFYLHMIIQRRALARQRVLRKKKEYPMHLRDKAIKALPFTLTSGQERTIKEAAADLGGRKPMARLIQGDVGSGKTLAAFLSALPVIEAGRQAAFLAPTELLARQHAENAARFLEPLGIRLALLHGNLKKSERKLLLKALAKGEIDLIMGTHALFSKDVAFKDLGLIIIDEQHRFGVMQRIAMVEKGETPDLLLMTATPIPRTLTISIFGDLDVSTIDTMPPGRKPVITHLAAESSRDRVFRAVQVEFERGHQAFFVYPRIAKNSSGANSSAAEAAADKKSSGELGNSGKGGEFGKMGSKGSSSPEQSRESRQQSGSFDLRDAESMYQELSSRVFPGIPGGIIHSKLPEEEKKAVMERFRKGELSYVVATSVVEVGVDIPNATCMVIEHAERFGLSALHQLRGRVGRGGSQAYTFLIFSDTLTDQGKERLRVMRETSDGFVIAEEDLKIRGPGDIAGTQQSGFLQLTFSDLVRDFQILLDTRKRVLKLIKEDPGLLEPRHKVIRTVLQKVPPFQEENIYQEGI